MKLARVDWKPTIRPEPIERLRIANLDGSPLLFYGHARNPLPRRVREFFCRHEALIRGPLWERVELALRCTASGECRKCGLHAYAALDGADNEQANMMRQRVADHFDRLSRGWWRCL